MTLFEESQIEELRKSLDEFANSMDYTPDWAIVSYDLAMKFQEQGYQVTELVDDEEDNNSTEILGYMVDFTTKLK